ncbi:MAG: NAD(P)-dependent oxidoreductase, partial [Candidatus Eremiobacterota bacterium]
GVNTIDVEAASARGIFVTNCPGKNAAAVAELAVGLILSLDRRIPDNVTDLRNGLWNKKDYSKSEGIKGKTVGVIGTGQIGQEVMARLRPFGVRLVGWSRSLTPEMAERLEIERCADRLELARQSDIVTVHVALTSDTRGFLNQAFFDAMKPGALFINTSRAEVVDSQAMLTALNAGKIRVGTDVFDQEPSAGQADFDNPVAKHPAVVGTCHIGASTQQAEFETGEEAARIARAYVTGHPIPNCVNMRETPANSYGLMVRHEDRVGVLAGVFQALKEEGLNVQEMENLIFAGARAACAHILLDNPVPDRVLQRLTGCDGVIFARATEPGVPAGV